MDQGRIVNVSIGGCKIELFEKKAFLAYVEKAPRWMTNTIATYSGNPYQHLDEMLNGYSGNCGQGPIR